MRTNDLVQTAQDQTGVSRFACDSYQDGLDLLVQGYNRCETLTPFGRLMLEVMLVQALSERLRIDDWHERNPQAALEAVTAPVFIVGVPRTGTTLLANLLGLDPRWRALRLWESDAALPPPEAATFRTDPRIARKKTLLDQQIQAGAMLPHFEGAEDPAEDWFLLGQDFKTLTMEHPISNQGFNEWYYQHADFVPAYRHHRRVLQLLQSRAPGRWLLKLPSHVLNLAALLEVYPDARFITLHRDPLKAVGSYCSLARIGRKSFHSEVDPHQIGAQLLPQLVEHACRLMAFRDAHPETPFLDLQYQEFKKDPLAVIRCVYGFLGEDLTPELEQVMREHLAQHPEQPFGKHHYTLEEFGFDQRRIRALFSDYGARYDIPSE